MRRSTLRSRPRCDSSTHRKFGSCDKTGDIPHKYSAMLQWLFYRWLENITKANGLDVSKVSPGLYWMESVIVGECHQARAVHQVSDHHMMTTPGCPHSGEGITTLRPAECQAWGTQREAGPGPLEARVRPRPHNIYYLDSQDTEYRAFYAQAQTNYCLIPAILIY